MHMYYCVDFYILLLHTYMDIYYNIAGTYIRILHLQGRIL